MYLNENQENITKTTLTTLPNLTEIFNETSSQLTDINIFSKIFNVKNKITCHNNVPKNNLCGNVTTLANSFQANLQTKTPEGL